MQEGSSSHESCVRNEEYLGNRYLPEDNKVQEDYLCAILESMNMQEEFLNSKAHQKSSVNDQATIDLCYCLELRKKELEEYYASAALARSLRSCTDIDNNLLVLYSGQDELEIRDRALARMIERTGVATEDTDAARLLVDNIRIKQVIAESDNGVGASDSFASIETGVVHSTTLEVEQMTATHQGQCLSCLEDSTKLFRLVCKHLYCKACLRRLCISALRDINLVPIRCCGVDVPNYLVYKHYSEQEIMKYARYLNDFTNPPQPRQEEADKALALQFEELGWKRCPKCSRFVERSHGCIHMTCLCRNEFCMTCLRAWKSCTCELYPPRELERILDERADPAVPGDREAVRMNLVNYYDGHVHEWRSRANDGSRCSGCNWLMDKFRLVCITCRETMCRRCRYNR